MRLISTKQTYEPSIDQIELAKMHPSQKERVFVPLDSLRQFQEESSIFLKPIKDIELLEHSFTFNKPIEIKRFILAHNYLIEPLFEAYEQIKRVFQGQIIDLCLDYEKDPEEDFEGLFILVKTSLSPEASIDLLDIFDEEYWLAVDDKISNILEVMVRPL